MDYEKLIDWHQNVKFDMIFDAEEMAFKPTIESDACFINPGRADKWLNRKLNKFNYERYDRRLRACSVHVTAHQLALIASAHFGYQ